MAKGQVKPRSANLNGWLCARVSPEVQAEFAALCRARGISASEGVRRLVREVSGFGPTLDADSARLVKALAGQTRAIGHNVNQWTRAMHLGQTPVTPEVRGWIENVAQLLDHYEALFNSLCTKARARTLPALDRDRP